MDEQRMVELEAKVWLNHEYTESLKTMLFQTLQELHRKGVLRMQDVASRTEASAAFAKAAFDKAQPNLLSPLVDALREIGNALDANQQRDGS